MTTTPGAVRGILVVGARKHSTLQATAPRRTTTLSTGVRIHPAPTYASPPLSFGFSVSASSRTPAPLPCSHVFAPPSVIINVATRAFYERQYLLSSGLGVRAVRLWMQVREGHGCCRRGGLLRWKDVEIAEQLLLNL